MKNKRGTKPYVVLGITINNFEYYIPLSSPKFSASKNGITKLQKPRLYQNLYHILQREDQNNDPEYLGTLLFSNMITAPSTEVRRIEIAELFKTNPDYAVLLTKQIDIIKNSFDSITNQASLVHKMYSTIKDLPHRNYVQNRIFNECCDFIAIEKAKSEFEKNEKG